MTTVSVRYKINKYDLAEVCEEERFCSRFKAPYEEAIDKILDARSLKEAYRAFEDAGCDIDYAVRKKFDKAYFRAVEKLTGEGVLDIDEGPTEFITESSRQFINFYDLQGRVYRILVIWEKINPLEGRFIFEYNPHMYE